MLHGAELLEMSPSFRDYEPPVVDVSSYNTKGSWIELNVVLIHSLYLHNEASFNNRNPLREPLINQ